MFIRIRDENEAAMTWEQEDFVQFTGKHTT